MSLEVSVMVDQNSDPRHIRATARYLYALADTLGGVYGKADTLDGGTEVEAPVPEGKLAPAVEGAVAAVAEKPKTRGSKPKLVEPPAPAPEPVPEPEPEMSDDDLFGDTAEIAPPKEVTLEDVKVAARNVLNLRGSDAVRKLMTECGLNSSQKLTNLPPAKFVEFVTKADRA